MYNPDRCCHVRKTKGNRHTTTIRRCGANAPTITLSVVILQLPVQRGSTTPT